MRKMTLVSLAVTICGSAFCQNSGPGGYWMSAGNNQSLSRYDHGVTHVYATSGGQDYPIAVSGDVRTAASGQFDANDHGGLYDLNGVWQGVNYFDFGPSNF